MYSKRSSMILALLLSLISMNLVHGAPIIEETGIHANNDEEKAVDESHKHNDHNHAHDHGDHDIKIDPIVNQEKNVQDKVKDTDDVEGTSEGGTERKKRQYYDHSHCYHDHCHDYYSDGHSHTRYYGGYGGYRGYGGWGRRWNWWG